MRIGIDARFYGPIGKGLGRYTQKLIENLEKIDTVNEYFIFLKKENFDDYKPKNDRFRKVLADFRWYTVSEQLKFPRLLKKYELDLVHFPHFNVPIFYFGKMVVTIHDLILLHFPTARNSTLSPYLYKLKFLAYKFVIHSAVHRSNRIVAVSKFTKKDILEHYKRIPQEKIAVTYEACDDHYLFNPQKDVDILSRYGIIKPYILYVGNVYPHKNPERLVLAMKEVKKRIPGLRLVFVGANDFFYERLKELVRSRDIPNIDFPGFIPDYDLDTVFRSAQAYIRPSLYEGFELPALEAMARETVVLCAEHSCAREILGESAFFFDGKDISSIAEAIIKVSGDPQLRKDLIERGKMQIKKFSWRKMASETLELYRKIKIK